MPARDGGPDIDIVVDFLMPRDAKIAKNNPPFTSNFAVQRAHGADRALEFYEKIVIEGDMPDGGKNRVHIAVASIPALLAMKGYAINNRLKRKDAYDIYYCIRNYPDGIAALVEVTRPLLKSKRRVKATVLSPTKFVTLMTLGRRVCVFSWKVPRRSATEARSNGNRTLLDRLMLGSEH